MPRSYLLWSEPKKHEIVYKHSILGLTFDLPHIEAFTFVSLVALHGLVEVAPVLDVLGELVHAQLLHGKRSLMQDLFEELTINKAKVFKNFDHWTLGRRPCSGVFSKTRSMTPHFRGTGG